MSDYKFSSVQRFVVFTVFGPDTKCYLCREPVTLKTMQVDHLIPEHLISHPVRLKELTTELGLPADFDLNSYENWLPSCGPCNNAKRNDVYEPGPMYLALFKRAAYKAEKCRALELHWKCEIRIDKALGYLEAAAENEELELERLMPLLNAFVGSNPALRQEMIAALEGKGDSLSFVQTTTFAIAPKLHVIFGGGSYRVSR